MRTPPRGRRMRRAWSAALAVVLAGGLTAVVSGPAAADPSSTPVTKTKKVTRTFEQNGSTVVKDEKDVSVTIDHTANLRGRERVQISWSGARPSGGRATNPFGEKGMAQEYPVVILQCRGLDDDSLPADQQVSPQTCWTSTYQQRSRSVPDSLAAWRHDPYADESARAKKSGLDPYPAAACGDIADFSSRTIPFVAASGKVYSGCSADTMPPEAAADAALPPSEQAAFTDLTGRGSTSFEVRTETENESLGCSDQVACSIVVIPIEGLSCQDNHRECQRSGQFAPGSSNFASLGVDSAVSPLYWWSASNWRNRISFPLTLGTPPNVCDILDSRAPTAFYGSELMSQAALQWAPAYCLNAKRFKFQHNRMGDEPAFALMEKGGAPAALVSGLRENDSDEPIAYAPTAVTGFAVSYVIDRPDNGGEYRSLRLNARLLAKLLTQSYTGSSFGAQHPGMSANPKSINLDPEFQQLNPGLDSTAREAAATILSLSESSDVLSSITSYIAADADAKAFIAGKADRWGMVVNPSYRGISLPIAEWPLQDTFVPTYQQECQKQLSTPYFNQLAAPVSNLRTIAEAVLDGWPNVQTTCDRSSSTDPWKFGRVERQGVGSRFMLGIVSLGDAARLGLDTAALRTSATTYVGPTTGSMAAAVSAATKVKGQTGVFSLAATSLAKKPAAYPGTMIVYTAARTSGLASDDAAKVAQFIRIATTEGQRRGSANGTLPGGFLPITNSGATKPLYAAAQVSAALIAAQKGIPSSQSTTGSTTSGAGGSTAVTGSDVALAAPAVVDPAAAAGQAAGKQAATPVETAPTAATTSKAGRLALPLLLLVGLCAGAVAPVVRRAGQIKAARAAAGR